MSILFIGQAQGTMPDCNYILLKISDHIGNLSSFIYWCNLTEEFYCVFKISLGKAFAGKK